MPRPDGMKTWEEVVGSPEFHALTPEDQEGAKMQYFEANIAPNLPEADREPAMAQFMGDFADPASQLQALTKTFTPADPAPQAQQGANLTPPAAPSQSAFQMAGLPGSAMNAAAQLTGGGGLKGAADSLNRDADVMEGNLQFGGQIAGNFVGGPAGGVMGGTMGRAISELSQIIRGKKAADMGQFQKDVGAGFTESTLGEIGGKLLGVLAKSKTGAKILGAGIGGLAGGEVAETLIPGNDKRLNEAGRMAGTAAGAAAGFAGPGKMMEIGVRALGNVSKFAAERIAQRGANVVLDDAKMDPGFFGKVASKAADIFNDLKDDAYRAFEKTADKIKWNPNFTFDVRPIQNEMREYLVKMGALGKNGLPAKNPPFTAQTPEMNKLVEIYGQLLGKPFGQFPKAKMDFQSASRLMNYLDNAIPEVTYGDVTKAASPFVASLKMVRNGISAEMKNASPVLRQAYEDYAKFADMRASVYPILKNEVAAESKLRSLLNGTKNAERVAFEKMLSLHKNGAQVADDLYDAAAAKEFYNFTVGGKAGIGKEAAGNFLKATDSAKRVAMPVGKGIKEAARRTIPAGLSGLI